MKRLLCRYFEGITIVAMAGHYYESLFKGYMGVTQGDKLSPAIFNMVVNAVIQHWETVVEGEDKVPEGFRRSVNNLATLFYVDNGILASPQLDRIQEALDFLMILFDQVCMRINVNNMVGMVCQPCCNTVRKYEVAYTRRMKGEGLSHRSR